jgi:hypothetical protein
MILIDMRRMMNRQFLWVMHYLVKKLQEGKKKELRNLLESLYRPLLLEVVLDMVDHNRMVAVLEVDMEVVEILDHLDMVDLLDMVVVLKLQRLVLVLHHLNHMVVDRNRMVVVLEDHNHMVVDLNRMVVVLEVDIPLLRLMVLITFTPIFRLVS